MRAYFKKNPEMYAAVVAGIVMFVTGCVLGVANPSEVEASPRTDMQNLARAIEDLEDAVRDNTRAIERCQ